MVKNFLITLLALMLITVNMSAQYVEFDSFGYMLNNTDMTAEVVCCRVSEDNVVIPETVDCEGKTYTVTSIGFYYDEYEYEYTKLSPFCDMEDVTITLPKTINKIAPSAFLNPSISAIRCIGNEPPTVTDEIVPFYGNVTLYVPEGSKRNFQSAKYWENFGDCREISADATILNTMEHITFGNFCFIINHEYKSAALEKNWGGGVLDGDVEIPSTFVYEGEDYKVKYICPEPFYKCLGITSLVIPETVEEASFGFLQGINLLGSITLKSTKPIKLNTDYLRRQFTDNSIMNFTDQTILYVPEGSKASYQSDTCWNSFTNIKEYNGSAQFQERLKCVEIDNITYALCDMNNTAAVITPDNEPYISYYADNFIVPKTVTYEGNIYEVSYITRDVFGYGGPKSVILPEGLKKISGCAFCGNDFITEIILPSTLEYIAPEAFVGCNQLKTIYSESKIPYTISSIAFDFMNDQKLIVPVNTKNLYEVAEGWKNFTNIEEDVNLGIDDINVPNTKKSKTYDIQGRRVNDTYYGIRIRDGKKILL